MKVAFITTIRHNIGDDFVREGIKFILNKLFLVSPKYYYIHKHIPATVRFGFENLRSLKWSERIERFLPDKMIPDKIALADVVVQSGAPLYWYHNERIASYNNEWYEPLIERRTKLDSSKKLLNIGVGACQQYNATVNSFLHSPQFLQFVNDFYELCDITITRDKLSRDLLSHEGKEAAMLPCPSIFSSDNNNLQELEGEYIILNYMEGGGHYDFGENINRINWHKTFSDFYNKIKNEEKIIFCCHNLEEYNLAKKMFPDAYHFYSNRYVDYINLFSKSKFGIVNRVHAAFQLASNFKPSFLIGSDSRARMGELIGVETIFVNDVSTEILLSQYEKLSDQSFQEKFKQNISSLKSEVENSYCEILKNYI